MAFVEEIKKSVSMFLCSSEDSLEVWYKGENFWERKNLRKVFESGGAGGSHVAIKEGFNRRARVREEYNCRIEWDSVKRIEWGRRQSADCQARNRPGHLQSAFVCECAPLNPWKFGNSRPGLFL